MDAATIYLFYVEEGVLYLLLANKDSWAFL